jgi:dinuclear metal center YbgI/SA1388 family protein
MHTIADVVEVMRRLAPESWAEEWDNVGWLVRSRRAAAKPLRVVLSLDPVEPEAAAEQGYSLNLTHHPSPFRPLRRLDDSMWAARAYAAGVDLYAAHTNLDAAPGGVNDALASALGIVEPTPLLPGRETMLKFVTFVPESHVDDVRAACAAAGAGLIGLYEECSFETRGTGTFRPLSGAQPFTGSAEGRLAREPEVRLEMLTPARLSSQVVAAARAAHPYEEMAFDLVALANRPPSVGIGRVGRLAEAVEAAAFVALVGERLDCSPLAAGPDKTVRTVAVIGGSGGDYWKDALDAGADACVTGEASHHHALDAAAAGLVLVAAGHFATERVVLPAIKERLETALPGVRVDIAPERDPWRPAGRVDAS